MKKFAYIVIWSSLLFVLALVFYLIFSYFFPNQIKQDKKQKEQEKIIEEQKKKEFEVRIQSLYDCINSIPDLLGKNKKSFYFILESEHHGQDVFYFNLNDFANYDLSPEEVTELCNDMKKAEIVDEKNISYTPESELPENLKRHNSLFGFDGSFLIIKNKLENSYKEGKLQNKDDIFHLAHIYEMEGNYAGKNELDSLICQKFNERCENGIEVEVTGKVSDGNGQPIQGAYIEVLNFPNDRIIGQTDNGGNFKLNFKSRDLDKIRLRARKRNFSDGIVSFYAMQSPNNLFKYKNANFVLNSAIDIVTIDNKDIAVTGEGNRIKGNYFIITTSRTTYKIPMNGIIDRSGKPYSGPIDVYLYEFDRNTNTTSILSVDTFDQVIGYAGDIMKSYGMPYIQFFSKDGKELYVEKSNPMITTYKIPHMKELLENVDQIYEENLTMDDMEFLVEESKKGGYPIDRKFLIENQMLRFPAFWAFDQRRGVWDNVGMKVLDKNGTVEIPWYTIKN